MNRNIQELRVTYGSGENITEKLRSGTTNTLEAIEIAYDLQSGSYISSGISNKEKYKEYTAELGNIIKEHVTSLDTILDCGAGELTTLSRILPNPN